MHLSPTLHARTLLICLAALLMSPVFAADDTAKLSLQAKLFYSKSGGFSGDILAPGGPELGNVVIRDDPSTSSFVIGAITLADAQEMPFNSRVRLLAREPASKRARSRVVLDRVVTLAGGRKGGVTHIGFWLSDIGCRPVELQATLSAAQLPKTVATKATLPFVCNE